jgi:hypothetical protein
VEDASVLVLVYAEPLVFGYDLSEHGLAFGHGTHGGHEPRVEAGTEVKALVAVRDEDGIVGAGELVRTQPFQVLQMSAVVLNKTRF